MKKSFFGLMAVLAGALACVGAFVKDATTKAHDNVLVPFMHGAGLMPTLVLLGRSYKGYPAGQIVQLSTNEEAALIAQGLATNSAGPVTTGNVSTNALAGRAGIAAAGTQVVVTNPAFDVNSKFTAALSNAAADGTATSISRIIPAAGQVTFVLNAAATGAVSVDWALLMLSGELPPTNS